MKTFHRLGIGVPQRHLEEMWRALGSRPPKCGRMRGIGEESTMSPGIDKSDDDWKSELTPERYDVLRRAGTEPPFSGEYVFNKDDGIYRCAACGAELFSSETKFESGTGWPSFTEPTLAERVELIADMSHGMLRTEVRCRQCGGHLGHVFDDGPGPAGQRYCINSLALKFDPVREQ